MPTLFDPLKVGDIELKNRIIMAPMTRSRADDEGVQPPYAAEYYSQRASAGLIITEATNISPMAKGYIRTPGMYTDRLRDQASCESRLAGTIPPEFDPERTGPIDVLHAWRTWLYRLPDSRSHNQCVITVSNQETRLHAGSNFSKRRTVRG
jgi:hypothetical protein